MIVKPFEPAYIIEPALLPQGFCYPRSYVEFYLRKPSLLDGKPWSFFSKGPLATRVQGLKERYPSRQLVPFALRVDNDDVACFVAGVASDNPPVILIHDFASSGWEHRGDFQSFEQWLQFALLESREWKRDRSESAK